MLDHIDTRVVRVVAELQAWRAQLAAEPELIELAHHRTGKLDFVARRAEEVAGRFRP
ncbi:hypothetical protein D3C76_1435740 [compost metagenome]